MGRGSWKVPAEAATAATDGERNCARLEWCASSARVRMDDGSTARVPARGPRAFCHADEVIIGTALRSFPDAWKRLWPAMLRRVTGEVLVRIPFGPSVPVRCDLDEVMRMLVDCALTWHERVARIAALAVPDTQDWHRRALGRQAPLILAASVAVLAERVPALISLETEPMVRPELVAVMGCGIPVQAADGTVLVEAGGAEAGMEILRLDYLARACLGETDPDRDQLLGVACPECGHRALRRAAPAQHDGDQAWFASCDDCRELLTDAEYGSHTARLVRFYASRVTPAVLASAGLRGGETPAITAAVA